MKTSVKNTPISVILNDEPFSHGEPERLTFLQGETQLENKLLREVIVSRLAVAALDWSIGIDDEPVGGTAAFGICRDESKAYGWITPVQTVDGSLNIVIEANGAYFWAHGFARHPSARVINETVEEARKQHGLEIAADLARRWAAQGADPIFCFCDKGGPAIKITHPKTGCAFDVTYINLSDPGRIQIEGLENRQVVRSPRTNPYITTRTARSRAKLKDLTGRDILRLTAALAFDVEMLESDNAPDDE